MRRIACAANGNCLFIALYVAYELHMRSTERSTNSTQEISGTDGIAIRRGARVKSLLLEFYAKNNWSKETPFGTRKQILLTELSCLRDLTDDDLEDYCKTLSWGSTPEYLAFAVLANVSIEIYVPTPTGYVLRDAVRIPSNAQGRPLRLVFDRQHYDVLIEEGPLEPPGPTGPTSPPGGEN